MMSWIQSDWRSLTEGISKLHEQPVFLPRSFIKGTMFPSIVGATFCLTVVYFTCLLFVDRLAPASFTVQQKSKICYQFTNVCFNITIGCLGLYLEYVVLPATEVYDGPSVNKILGMEQELYLVSALQLGYQFWAIPVGYFHVNESREMMIHHWAVVISTSMTGFLSIGFRYYSPFFYGVMELSSVPLSVMNAFKENHLQQKYPLGYSLSRITFVLSFILIRVHMCFFSARARAPIFLRDNFLVLYTREMGFYKLYMIVQWSLAAFLAALQIYWASLIFNGIIRMLSGGYEKKKRKES